MIQPINQKHKGLPPELAAIKHPTTISECLDIIYDLSESENYIDKYKMYLANTYFQDNIIFLNIDQIQRGFKSSYVRQKYDPLKTLHNCIRSNIAFPIMFPNIINKSLPLETVSQYCSVLSKNGNLDQLNDIWKAYKLSSDSEHPIIKLFKNTQNPTNTLVEVMIQNDAKYILQAKTWSNEKVIEWIHENKTKSIEIISNASSSVLTQLPLIIQHAFYNNAIEYFIDPQNNKDIDIQKKERNFLINMPISYVQYLQSDHTDYLNNKLKKQIRIQNNGNAYTMNICQYIVFERKFNSVEEINTFSIYKDLLKNDIREQIGLYLHETLAFEYALKNNKYSFFTSFNLNDSLKNEEKNILVAFSFNCLISHINAKSKNHSNSWVYDIYDETVNNCSEEEFNKYANVLDSMNNAPLSKQLDNYRLIRKVNSMPIKNTKQDNKLKI